jgi:hypothetical protein
MSTSLGALGYQWPPNEAGKLIGWGPGGRNLRNYSPLASDYTAMVNPMEPRFGASGDGVDDDTAAVQAAVDAVENMGGGIVLLTKPHRITSSITYTSLTPIAFEAFSASSGYLIFEPASDIPALDFSIVGAQADNHIRLENIGIYHNGTTRRGTAVNVDYSLEGGGNNPSCFVMRGCTINRVSGATGYFANGVLLNLAPSSLIERNFIRGGGTLTADKLGDGIGIAQWAQGTVIRGNRIYGWNNAISISDERYIGDPNEYQAEGVAIHDNKIISCDTGLYGSSTTTENSWTIYNNTLNARQRGIYIRNITGLEITGNKFQTNGGNSDLVNIMLQRDGGDVAVPLGKGQEAVIANNRAFGAANLTLTLTGVTLASEAVITYTVASTAKTITAISSTNPAVVTYSGTDVFTEGDELYISGITAGPTELNGLTIIAGTIDTGANTVVLEGVDGTAFSAAWSAGGTIGFFEQTGSIANGDVVYIYEVNGTTQINDKPWIVSDLNTGAGTFKIKDYYTQAYVNSSAWTAYSNTGTIVRYQRFLEIVSGSNFVIEGNMTSRKNVGVHLWANAKNLRIGRSNRFINTGSPRNTVNYINDSSFKSSIKIDITDSSVPVTKTANFTVADDERIIIVNQAGTTTVTLPTAANYPGDTIMLTTIQAQLVVSVASDVVPRIGGSAGTAILPATDGAWARLVSDGSNWIIVGSGT